MSIELMQLVLSGLPPSANNMYRTGRNGNRYKRSEVSEWQDGTAAAIREAWGNGEAYTGQVEVRIVFTVKGNRRWDIDNRLKALLDCLELGGVIADDSQIWGIQALRVSGYEDTTSIEMRGYTGQSEKSSE